MFLILVTVAFFVSSAIFTLVVKLFKVQNLSYKKSLIILFSFGLIGIIVEFIANFVFLFLYRFVNVSLFKFLLILALFFPFHYLLKKYYQTAWKKSLGIYFVFEIIMNVLVFLLSHSQIPILGVMYMF
jgi:hypothetical protein